MKIVTYNVNGLRQRVSQHGSLLKLLNSLDADIICLQETKLQRRDLSVDVTMAEGYEAFVSCTHTSSKGRLGYSGVATFCRVKSAFSTDEAALPLAAEEGFTGLLESPKEHGTVVNNFIEKTLNVEGLEHATIEDILKVDSEGRCIITDHGHFVLFNLYGPRADSDDMERTHFKFLFFRLLQRRWESLLSQGKRVVVVGDLNIAPAAIDRCDAEPEFEKNMFRTWLRSMLRECDGPFVDAFRSKHPNRKDAYTCFCPRIGAEEFNYGSRIDHILISGPCLHGNHCLEHSLFDCHVERCDIMNQFLRGNFDGRTKWNGGRSIKLQGSDHIPVYVMLNDMPNLPLHSTPALAVRYVPEIHGQQQTIVSFLSKRCVPDANENPALLNILSGESVAPENDECSVANWDNSMSLKSGKVSDSTHLSFYFGQCSSEYVDHRISKKICTESNQHTASDLAIEKNSFLHNAETPVKKVRSTAYSQLTLKSFFHKQKPSTDRNINEKNLETSYDPYDNGVKTDDIPHLVDLEAVKNLLPDVQGHMDVNISKSGSSAQDQADSSCFSFKTEKANMALLEWQRIQQKMKVSIPLCKGHSEACVARSVKKVGPNIGQRFYVCARAQGPAANPEANCGHFEWANKRSNHRK